MTFKKTKNETKDFCYYGTISLYLTVDSIRVDKKGNKFVMTPFGYTRLGKDFHIPNGKPRFATYDFSVYTGRDEENESEYYAKFYLWGLHEE